jgi:3-dehydroquinate synthase
VKGLLLLQEFVRLNTNDIIVLADEHTLKDCYPLLGQQLRCITVPHGEGSKNLASCTYIWEKLTDMGASRSTILLCLGGGVLCDMGAYAGACYQRGIPVVLVPTSLLAMVDASTGGKTGVNFLHFKNYIGLFKKSEELFLCPEFLKSLPQSEMRNGHVEMLKHGLIADKEHYDQVKMLFLQPYEALNPELISHSIAIKERHVEQDFKDVGIRKRLNFGHTIGHAIESHSLFVNEENESLSHGTSVGLGMVVESYISHKVAGLSENQLHEITSVLKQLVTSIDEDIPPLDTLLPYLLKDKKNENQAIRFSLLKNIGECEHNYEVDVHIIAEGLDFLRELK